VRAQSGFLRWMGRGTQRVDRACSAQTAGYRVASCGDDPSRGFPSYFISEDMPVAPGRVGAKSRWARGAATTFSLEQLQQLTRTTCACAHHCVEGSAVAAWARRAPARRGRSRRG